MNYFYDTCSLLNDENKIFKSKQKFYISSITLKQLQEIKTSPDKNQSIKIKARHLINKLIFNSDKYDIVYYQKDWDNDLKYYPTLTINNDSKIILSALKLKEKKNDLIFITQDLCCAKIAETTGLKVQYAQEKNTNYTGYIYAQYKNDDELADLYKKIYDKQNNNFHLLINEYFFIKDENGKIIDKYKYTTNGCEQVPFVTFESKMFGKTKPKDDYQLIAMDSLKNNRITMLNGPAGAGKSYLAMTYLFDQFESGKIDKIIIFCNTVATAGAAKLGFYPGTRDQKLLDSQIGNFLSSKIGDRRYVEDLIEKEKILLLPLSDIRGFDTSGMHAGIYITEAQNMNIEMMKLCLQRIGEDCFCILDGDFDAQVDLEEYAGNNNGLRRVSQVFRNHKIFGEVTLPIIYRSQIAKIAQEM